MNRIFLACLLTWAVVMSAADAAEPTHVLIVVGPSSHPPGSHEVAAGGRLMKHCLENMANVPGVVADVVYQWPTDRSILNSASTLVFIGDTFPPQRWPNSETILAQIDAMMARGCGIVCVHYATGLWGVDVSDDGKHPLLNWLGGYFANKTCPHHQGVARIYPAATITPTNREHPILRGWNEFTLHDEPYINNYFGEDNNRRAENVTALATSMLPPESPQKETVSWCVERADGGRGFAIVMPHFYKNWANEDLRRFLLNGIVWTSKTEVPDEGVKTSLPELMAFSPASVEVQPALKTKTKAKPKAKTKTTTQQSDGASLTRPDRPRLAILTDIGGDPDDQQSMIRLMLYANEFNIECLMATAVRREHAPDGPTTRPDLIRVIVDAYGEVLPNLRQHADHWPGASQLRDAIFSGNPRYGRDHVGAEHDTDASGKIIELVDRGDPQQPLNIAIWGGQTDLAQALWRVQHDRDQAGYLDFVGKLRIYDINDQDDIADWMRTQFPGLFYILAKAPSGTDKRLGIYRGVYLTNDESLTSQDWIEQNVRSRGPLGLLYPTKTYTAPNPHRCMKEGDTPSWFFFLPQSGNRPSDPTVPGWGGQFRQESDGWYRDIPATDSVDPRTVISSRRPEFQSDFAARMSWCSDAIQVPQSGQ